MPRWPEREPLGDPNDRRGFSVLIERFCEWLGIRGFSEQTGVTARYVLRSFAEWCLERGVMRPTEVTRQVIERYQRWLYHYRRKNGRPLAYATQHSRLVHLRHFFRFLAKERYLLYNPAADLELPKVSRRLPLQAMTVAEAEQVLAQPNVETPRGLRDRAILETFYSTGIRRNELINLDLYDLDTERSWVTVRLGKGGKDRVVPIGERALAWVARYLEEARPQLVVRPDEWAVFLTFRGERFARGVLTRQVRRLIEAAAIGKRGSCHLFRHTMATLMLEGGADVRYIQEMLGHSNLETTERYTKVSIQQLQAVHRAAHPARLERTATVAELAGEVERDELLSSLAAELSEEDSDGAGDVDERS